VGRPKKGKSEEGKGKSDNPDEAPLQALAVAAKVLAKVEADGIRYEEGSYNAYTSSACYEMNRHGVPEELCRQWAVSHFADYDTPSVEAIVRSCYLQTDEHGSYLKQAQKERKAERKYATVEDIEEFLSQRIRLRYNTISRMVEYCPLPIEDDSFNMQPASPSPWADANRRSTPVGAEVKGASVTTTADLSAPRSVAERFLDGERAFTPFQDKDLNSLWREMSKTCGMRVIKDDMCSVIRSDFAQQYNPFEEYIRSLPAWDGETDYIGRLASSVTVASDADEWREVLRKWFVGFIAGLFMPDEVNHGILVFIGEQGKYKSTWFYYLLPEELRRYFLIKLMDGYITKDDLFNIAQSALVCLEEIDNMKQKELNQLKALTTMRTISARPAYGRFNEHLPHIASFCATGNNPFFLTDDSTNRRFLTFEVIGIEPPQEYDFQYEGLYAQAYALWKQGFRYWFNEEDNRATSRRNRDFEAPSRERELIAKYYRAPMDGEQCKFLTASDILERIGALMHGLNVVKVGMAMTALGHKRLRLGDKRGYRLVELTMTDIENRQKMLGDTATNNEEALHTEYTTTTDVQQELPF
jgi:predicted P-loop ATPase